MSIIQRFIFGELFRIFILALLGLTSIFVLAGVVQEASQQGLGPEQVLRVIPLLLPSFLPYTVPATVLFAVAVVYGRLSHDNEITAMKAAGVPVRFAIWPAFTFSAIIGAAILALYIEFIPHVFHQLREMVLVETKELLYSRLRRDLAFNHPDFPYSIAVSSVNGNRLRNALFKKRDKEWNVDYVISAEEAEIDVNIPKREFIIRLYDGEAYNAGRKTEANNNEAGIISGRFAGMKEIAIPIPDKKDRNARARERSMSEILSRQKVVEEEMARKNKDLKAAKGDRELHSLRSQLVELRKEWSELRSEYAQRPALALGCVFFMLIGVPVAIRFQKSDFLSSFVTCFLPIVLLYYPLHMLAMNLARDKFPPHLIMWSGNTILGLIGLFLLWRVGKR